MFATRFSSALTTMLLFLLGGAVSGADLEVTVHYRGPGEVSQLHGLLVVAADRADLADPTARFFGIQYLTANGQTARFTGIEAKEAFVLAAWDERGGYGGTGPVPGPVGFHGTGGMPAPVSLDGDARVTVEFDDSLRPPGSEWRPPVPAEQLAAVEGGLVEIRIYKLKSGQREHFIRAFENHLGVQVENGLRVVGQFRALDDPDTFVWIRAFRDQEERLRLTRQHYFSDGFLDGMRHQVGDLLESSQVLLVEPTALSFLR
ncbi:MAG: hypothetical protein MPN21_01550 [Thermoanaerobaculia bacterium]|nr:hypothetical protein [Thermoanaerobaculia bacterium]